MRRAKYVYLIEFNNILKVGISGNAPARIKHHQSSLRSLGLSPDIKRSWISEKGTNAPFIESDVVKKFSQEGREWFKGNFDDVLSFIQSHPLKMECTQKDIDNENKAEKRIVDYMMSCILKIEKERTTSFKVGIDIVDAQYKLIEQAFCLLSENYTSQSLTPPEGELDLFFLKMSDRTLRLRALADFDEFSNGIKESNEEDISLDDRAAYFMFDFLEENGFHPFSPSFSTRLAEIVSGEGV